MKTYKYITPSFRILPVDFAKGFTASKYDTTDQTEIFDIEDEQTL